MGVWSRTLMQKSSSKGGFGREMAKRFFRMKSESREESLAHDKSIARKPVRMVAIATNADSRLPVDPALRERSGKQAVRHGVPNSVP
jgi:hypothetical protein